MSKKKIIKQDVEQVDTVTGEVIELDAIELSVNVTEDKAIVISSFREVVASVMNEAQFLILSGRTPKHIIRRRPGKGGKTFSYIPHGYVTSVLNKAMGFHWNFETLAMGNGDHFQFIEGRETQSNGRMVQTPGSMLVKGRLTCYIHDPNDISQTIAVIVKESTGEKEFVPGMTWGAMVKSAESDAFKRCATRLGIGNDLYFEEPDVLEGDANGHESVTPAPDAITVQVRELKASGKSITEIAKEMGLKPADVARRLRA